jgi:hypothetical protein
MPSTRAMRERLVREYHLTIIVRSTRTRTVVVVMALSLRCLGGVVEREVKGDTRRLSFDRLWVSATADPPHCRLVDE